MNHLGTFVHIGSLAGDQLMSIELKISTGALLVLLVYSASRKIKDYMTYLVGGKEKDSLFFQSNTISKKSCRNNIFAVSCPSYKQELEIPSNQIWI